MASSPHSEQWTSLVVTVNVVVLIAVLGQDGRGIEGHCLGLGPGGVPDLQLELATRTRYFGQSWITFSMAPPTAPASCMATACRTCANRADAERPRPDGSCGPTDRRAARPDLPATPSARAPPNGPFRRVHRPCRPLGRGCTVHWMTDFATLVSGISGTWFGSGLSEGSIERLAGMAREYESPARARLLREGDETKELSVLVDGRVALTEHVAGRGSVTLMTVEPGDVFGWSALINPFKATSTVVSLEPVKVIAFDAASLREEVRSNCELAAGIYPRLLEAMARRLGATRHQLFDLYGSEQREPW